MDAKALKEVTSELSILYIEDDDDLREETSRLFGHLFNEIEIAENGQLALDKMKEKNFDLIVTDINMPVMDGIAFAKVVRKKNAKQAIIVTSAHDESRYLMELIELGIDKFILKPLDMTKLISTLTQVCTNIMNVKLVNKYKKDIEKSNIQLTDSNQELETLVKILDTKIEQLNKVNPSADKEYNTINNNSNDYITQKPSYSLQDPSNVNDDGLYLYKEHVRDKDLKALEELELEIAALTVLINLQDKIENTSIVHLGDKLYDYAVVLDNYPLFNIVSNEISNLAQSLKGDASVFIEFSSDISILLESFLYVLKKWRVSLFETGIKNPNIYDTSMINDIQTIIIILQKDESLEHNHDFF